MKGIDKNIIWPAVIATVAPLCVAIFTWLYNLGQLELNRNKHNFEIIQQYLVHFKKEDIIPKSRIILGYLAKGDIQEWAAEQSYTLRWMDILQTEMSLLNKRIDNFKKTGNVKQIKIYEELINQVKRARSEMPFFGSKTFVPNIETGVAVLTRGISPALQSKITAAIIFYRADKLFYLENDRDIIVINSKTKEPIKVAEQKSSDIKGYVWVYQGVKNAKNIKYYITEYNSIVSHKSGWWPEGNPMRPSIVGRVVQIR